MPSAPPPRSGRVRYDVLYASRALFGLGFVVLGIISLVRVLLVHAPPNTKVLGCALGVVMIGLGVFRIGQYLRLRRSLP
jgi:hypothetical protein